MTPTETALRDAGLSYQTAGDVLDDLSSISARLATTTDNADALRHRRDALVAEAVALAAPREAVADAAGLSRQRVRAIARRQSTN